MAHRIDHLRGVFMLIFVVAVAEPPSSTKTKGVQRALFGYDEAVLTAPADALRVLTPVSVSTRRGRR